MQKVQLFLKFETPLSARLPSPHGEVSLAFREDTNAFTHSHVNTFLKHIHAFTLLYSPFFEGKDTGFILVTHLSNLLTHFLISTFTH